MSQIYWNGIARSIYVLLHVYNGSYNSIYIYCCIKAGKRRARRARKTTAAVSRSWPRRMRRVAAAVAQASKRRAAAAAAPMCVWAPSLSLARCCRCDRARERRRSLRMCASPTDYSPRREGLWCGYLKGQGNWEQKFKGTRELRTKCFCAGY